MRKWILPLLLFCLVISGGCKMVRINHQPEQEEGKEAVETPAKPKSPKGSAKRVFEDAKEAYVLASDLMDAGEYDQAKPQLDKAMSLILRGFDRKKDEETAKKIDSLFIEICVTQVRLGHLRGTVARVLPDDHPLDLEYNAEVERWLSFFLTNGRNSMEIYLTRSGKYNSLMEKILKEQGVPLELKYLPIIESGYSPYAYSPAAAVGLWQFIPSTGKHFGLRIDDWMDERRDPEKATLAAAQYLKQLHDMWDSWQLALASYNCGEGAVGRAVTRANHKNYWRLDLPNETCNYVPKFYAALIIARDPELYGFFVETEDPLEYDTLYLERPADLKVIADVIGVSYDDLKQLNPELLSQYTHPQINGYALKVPKQNFDEIKAAFDSTEPDEKYLSAKKIAQLKAPAHHGGGKVVYYRVKKGDSLGKIAKKFRTSVSAIKKWNKAARGKFIRPGMRLKIYVGKK